MNQILKLYKISHEDHPDDCVYIYTSLSDCDQAIRENVQEDYGGMDSTIWEKIHLEGKITEITSISQVPVAYQDTIPYNTPELYYSLVEFTISEFFAIPDDQKKEILQECKEEFLEFYEKYGKEYMSNLWEEE